MPHLSASEVCSGRGAIQIHVYLYLTFALSLPSFLFAEYLLNSPYIFTLCVIFICSLTARLSTLTWNVFSSVYCLYSFALVLVVVRGGSA